MKILAINWQDLANPQAGGAEIHITEILKRLVKRGHQATLFCSGFTGGKREGLQDGVRIIRRGRRNNFNWVVPLYLPGILKETNYDIVLEDINKLPFFSPLWHRLPTLVIIHHFFGKSIFKETNPVFGSYVLLGETLVPRFYGRFPFLTISNSSKQELLDRGIDSNQISVVHNGISDSYFAGGHESKKSSKPLIIYLGRVKKYKGLGYLIQAYLKIREKLPGVELKIVGSGDYLPEVKAAVRKLGLEPGVSFTGFVSEKEKITLLKQAWVSVYPSLKEGWGLTNIEANACGTPAVASNVPGLRDSVVDGKTGLLFRHGDVEDLSAKLLSILSDQSLSNRLIEGGKEWARQFSWDKTAQGVEELLTRVVREGRK